MADKNLIQVSAFGTEIGKLGYDPDQRRSFFQYNPKFLDSGMYTRIFPYIFRRVRPLQVFTEYEGPTFRGIPPMIADSLPDTFGNIIFREWFAAQNRPDDKITPLEQLTYVANRGMGALEYHPVTEIPSTASVNINEIVEVLQKVLESKKGASQEQLNHLALLNVFKIGTSAGGARPKILISEHKTSGAIIPGDLASSLDYNHYLVKLSVDENEGYNKEKVEYAYSLLAGEAGVEMMPCKLIDGRHFATERYDRQDGEKQHVLTVSGLTGWDFTKTEESSYENLFRLAVNLKVPHRDLGQLFRRMVFNLVFANSDDHLKNHSFIYNKHNDSWGLAPAYDLTYPFNLELTYLRKSRVMSINGKRNGIKIEDLLKIAEDYTVKNPKKIIVEVQQAAGLWPVMAKDLDIPGFVRDGIEKEFSPVL